MNRPLPTPNAPIPPHLTAALLGHRVEVEMLAAGPPEIGIVAYVNIPLGLLTLRHENRVHTLKRKRIRSITAIDDVPASTVLGAWT